MLAIAVTWLITQAVGATFCTEKDCYEIEQSVIDAKVTQCLYEAQVTMLVLDWKKRNKFKQVRIGNAKTITIFRKNKMYSS